MAFIGPDAVIQQVTNSPTTLASYNSSNSNFVEINSNYRVSITPKRSDSDILLTYTVSLNQQGNNNSIQNYKFQVSDNGGSTWSDFNLGTTSGSRTRCHGSFRCCGYDGNDADPITLRAVHENVGGTGTRIYRLVWRFADGACNLHFNLSSSNGTTWPWTAPTFFTATEIGQS